MGNTFTIYNSNKHFDIVANTQIYAFALVGLTTHITCTPHGSWTYSGEGTSDSKYNYIFRYKPGSVRSTSDFPAPGSWVFTLDTGNIPSNTVVHWVNGITASYDGNQNSSTPFSEVTYNVGYTESDESTSGGDVHIVPLYNPLNKIYILPTDDKIYKYFDNMDKDQRIVVNAKTWVLDNKFIYITDNLQKINSKYYSEAKNNITNYILNDNFSDCDTSFVKYITFMIKTEDYLEKITFDMENLLPVIDDYDYDNNIDIDIDNNVKNYTLKHKTVKETILKQIIVSDIIPFKKTIRQGRKAISQKNNNENYYREIKIDSNKHGLLIFNLIRLPSRVNHRNQVEFKAKERYRINFVNCSGVLIRTDLLQYVPSLFHINKDVDKMYMNSIKLLDTVEWRQRRSDLIKSKKLDFYSNVVESPEKEYLSYKK